MTPLTLLGILAFFVIPAILLLEVLRCAYLEYRSDRIPILLYHRLIARGDVAAGRTPDHEPIYAAYDDIFEAQMRLLSERGYTTLSLDEFEAVRAGRVSLPSKPVVLTFDDGYESNFTLAWPALRKYGHKATIFVAPEPDSYTRNLVSGFDDFLTDDQMRELDRGGVAIESHTLTHCVLSELPESQARHELEESRARLEQILSRPVRHLAVPRSGHSRSIRRLAADAGYRTICCNAKGSSSAWSDLLALPRIVVERDMSVADFGRALSPRAGLGLRLLGNLKRIPALVFGPKRAQVIRKRLYGGPFAGLFVTRSMKVLLGGGFVLYLLAAAIFTGYLLTR